MYGRSGSEAIHAAMRPSVSGAPGSEPGLRRRRVHAGDKWHLDEVALKIRGKRHWLLRAVDQHGVVLDVLVQERLQVAAERFLRRVLDGEAGAEPRVVITDKLASYPPAIRRALPNSHPIDTN